jgi:tRNA threonylcarbamoyladenosine biosynthesis protein TsaE
MALTISRSPAETFELGHALAHLLKGGEILALHGDLGAGKTHFVKGLAAGLGHTEAVTSPTYTLVHEYLGGRLPLYHFDFYRLSHYAEAFEIGLDEYLGSDTIVAVEWADKFPGLLPKTTSLVEFILGEGNTRKIHWSLKASRA